MSTFPKITLIGFYNYDDHFFDSLELPEIVDKDLFINSLLLKYGELRVSYSNAEFMKAAMHVWSLKYHSTIERIASSLAEEYNPIHNYDRYEESDDARTGKTSNSGSDIVSSTNEGRSSTTSEQSSGHEAKVSAFNEDNYTPDSRSDDEVSGQSNATDSATGRSETAHGHIIDTSEGNKHTAHLYGNIGVTTSTQMLEAEIDFRMKNNLYDIIAELFAKEFLLYLY